ncbi:PKD domain-containing protein [Natronomonas sp. EA1]|uniref:PKD domain-containing protein n=1 Tax=Natronomonas sp. EA1 TaxID=3421655 RepID=UPI003EBFE2F0
MADVIGRRDRAQLLLAGGLALAVVLVGLALVVNAVIYTENVATREDDPAADALRGHAAIVDGAGGIVDHVNGQYVGTPYATLYGAHYDDAFVGLQSGLRTEGIARGTVLQATDSRGYEGTQIVDDTDGAFEPQYLVALGANWTVAADSRVRGFEMNVSVSGLASVDPGTVQTLLGGVTDDVFVVTVEDREGRLWQAAVYENSDTAASDLAVTVRDVQTGTYTTCSLAGSRVIVDLTAGELQSGDTRTGCPGLDFLGEATGPVTVTYGNSDKISGTYSLVVDRAAGGLRAEVNRENGVTCTDPATYSTDPANPPYALPAIYGTIVTTDYTGPGATYETETWVAPGEPGAQPQVPQVRTLSVTDQRNDTTDQAKFEVSWTAADPNAGTVNATLTVTNTVTGATQTFANRAASGTVTFLGVSGSAGDTYTFELTTSDGRYARSVTKQQDADGKQNDCGSDSNSPPSASFSYSPSSPATGESVSFDASASGDDSGIASYEWDLDGDGATDDATGVTASTTFTTAGDHDVTLTVTDDDGATDSRTRTVTVTAASGAPSVDSIGVTDQSSDGPGNSPDEIEFDVSWDVSDPDPDLSTLRITLVHVPSGSQVDTVTVGLSGGGSPQSGMNTVSWKERGVYGDDFRIELRVEDAAGNTDTSSVTETANGGAG